MTTDTVAILGFVVLFVLMLLRVPVGMAMGLVGVCGFGILNGWTPALKLIGQSSMRTVTDYQFGVIPMFLLMGAFVTASGMSRELFRAAHALMGHRRGGLGFATILACGGFAAISGSSVATAATFSTVAYPEMRRHNYPQSFATGVIAAGGTLGMAETMSKSMPSPTPANTAPGSGASGGRGRLSSGCGGASLSPRCANVRVISRWTGSRPGACGARASPAAIARASPLTSAEPAKRVVTMAPPPAPDAALLRVSPRGLKEALTMFRRAAG